MRVKRNSWTNKTSMCEGSHALDLALMILEHQEHFGGIIHNPSHGRLKEVRKTELAARTKHANPQHCTICVCGLMVLQVSHLQYSDCNITFSQLIRHGLCCITANQTTRSNYSVQHSSSTLSPHCASLGQLRSSLTTRICQISDRSTEPHSVADMFLH